MLSEVQRILAHACAAKDPVATLARLVAAAAPGALTECERAQLRGLDPDGLVLSGRIVRELRLERILRGDAGARAAFDADPSGYSTRFTAWCDAEPAGSVFPADEAARWLASASLRRG